MDITGKGIHFTNLDELKLFAVQYKLIGIMKLSDPLKDLKGNILIKENTYVKESALEKLSTIEGQYNQDFIISLTSELLNSIKASLAEKIAARLDLQETNFINELYTDNPHNFKSYIQHSFQSTGLILTAFKLSGTKPQFFNHLADFGLISLGIIIQKNYNIRFINRYSFLAGFLADICHSGTDNWKFPPEAESAKRQIAMKSGEISAKLNLPGEVIESIKNHTITVFPFPSGLQAPLSAGSSTGDEVVSVAEDRESFSDNGKIDEKAALITTEVMKIARYIMDSNLHVFDRTHFSEELIYRVAYNAAKGYFHKELIAPVLKKFKKFETNIKKLTRIAEIEKECLHPPSAWAYPKPNAAQVLCQKRVHECPKIERGWDINVIAKQESFGWIGTSLEPGDYPKCSLESMLDKL